MMDFILPGLMALFVGHAVFARGKFAANIDIIKQYRISQIFGNVVVIGIVIGVAVWLINNVPYMDKNPILWIWSMVFGGDGTGASNVVFSGLQWKWYALVFIPMLLVALPSLARAEEIAYRQGTRDWAHGFRRSISFGLAHLIMLIPLGAALALTISGMWFTLQYFKGGVERSTLYHSMYNTIVVFVLAGTLIFA